MLAGVVMPIGLCCNRGWRSVEVSVAPQPRSYQSVSDETALMGDSLEQQTSHSGFTAKLRSGPAGQVDQLC